MARHGQAEPMMYRDSSRSSALLASIVRRSGPNRRLSALSAIAACAALVGCAAADDEAEGPPEFLGAPPSTSPGAAGASNPNTPAGMTPNPNPTPSLPNGSAGSGSEQVGGTGTPIANGSGGGTSAPAAGSNVGGSAQVPPSGAAGSGMGVAGSTSEGAGGTGQVEPPPPAPTGPDIDCPAGASFCSGFEGSAFPDGTQFHSVGPGSPNPFLFDSTDVFAGEQSLVIPATNSGGFFYRALAVPVPGQDFWARVYMNLSTPLGDNSHDSVFGASSGAITADVNGEALVELSEQFNEILLNTDDALFNPTTNTTLPANQWLCMEAHYNGGNGNVEIFADGAELINAPGYRAVTYQSFRIGYMRYNDDRTVRYDDLIVAPTRVGCN